MKRKRMDLPIEKKEDNTNKSVIMDVSTYSGIAQKINVLAQAIRNIEDAEKQLIYIECFTKPSDKEDEKDSNIIRFSTDTAVWTEIFTFNKYTTPILPKSVAVNLYDFYNVINNCNPDDTEMISFRIDENNPNEPSLIVSGYYNDLREYDEVEVSLKIHKIGFPRRKFKSSNDENKILTFELDQLALYTILRMNVENDTDGVNIVIKDRKMSFQTNYHGLRTTAQIKSYEDQLFFKDGTTFIPFYFLNLMAGTGQITPIQFHIYDDVLIVEAGGYNFVYTIDKEICTSFNTPTEGLEDFCVVDPKNAEAVLLLTNNINAPAKLSVARIKKIEDHVAEIQVCLEDRYKASVLIECIMQSNKELKVDTRIFQWMVSNTQVDGVKIQRYTGTDDVYIKYENELFKKTIHYSHEEFVNYRNEGINKLLEIDRVKEYLKSETAKQYSRRVKYNAETGVVTALGEK